MHRHLTGGLLDCGGVQEDLVESPSPVARGRRLARLVVRDDETITFLVEPIHDAAERHTTKVCSDILFGRSHLDRRWIFERPQALDRLPRLPAELLPSCFVVPQRLVVLVGFNVGPFLARNGLGHLDGALLGCTLHEQLEHPVREAAGERCLPGRIGKTLDVTHPPAPWALLERARTRRRES